MVLELEDDKLKDFEKKEGSKMFHVMEKISQGVTLVEGIIFSCIIGRNFSTIRESEVGWVKKIVEAVNSPYCVYQCVLQHF